MQSCSLPTDIKQIYDPIFVKEVARLAGRGAVVDDLQRGIERGARAYLKERREMTRRKPGKMEARRLEPIADSAHALHLALARIEHSPNPRLNLTQALEALVGSEKGHSASMMRAVETMFGPGDPIKAIKELTELLSRAAAVTVGKAPGPSAEDKSLRHGAALVGEIDRWRARPRKTETQPVLALVTAFRPTWERNSTHPYTEGMYNPEMRRTV